MAGMKSYFSIKDYLTDAVKDYLDHIECIVIGYSEETVPGQTAPYTILVMSEGHDRLCSIDLEIKRDQFSFKVFDSLGAEKDEINGQHIGSAASVSKLRQTVKKHVDLGLAAIKARAEAQSGGGTLGEEPTPLSENITVREPRRTSAA